MSDPLEKYDIYTFIVTFAIFFLTLAISIFYNSTKLTYLIIAFFVFLIIVGVSVRFIHKNLFEGYLYEFCGLISFAPIIVMSILLYIYPSISHPFDNTIGYFILNLINSVIGSIFNTKLVGNDESGNPVYETKSGIKQFEVMSKFESRMFPKDVLEKFKNEMSFNWLLTTVDKEDVDKFVDELKNKDGDIEKSIITDFYMNVSGDDQINNAKEQLKYLTGLKRAFGRGICIIISIAIGVGLSIFTAVPSSLV